MDDFVPASTVNLVLKILIALIQIKPSFYAKFKKDGGMRMLERVLPSFCAYGSIFYSLLCLLLGKPMQDAAPVPFEFMELFHHFKKPGVNENDPTAGPLHSIHTVEASYLILAMIKRSYEESQIQAAAGLSLSGSNPEIPPPNNLDPTIPVGKTDEPATFAMMIGGAHQPTLKDPAIATSPPTPNSVFSSFVGSIMHKVEHTVSTSNVTKDGEPQSPVAADSGSPPGKKKGGSILSIHFHKADK